MSAEMASSTDTLLVYVALLDEGTDVRRPVRAVPLGGMRFRLLPDDDSDPNDKHWEFPPGSLVECHSHLVDGREILTACRPMD